MTKNSWFERTRAHTARNGEGGYSVIAVRTLPLPSPRGDTAAVKARRMFRGFAAVTARYRRLATRWRAGLESSDQLLSSLAYTRGAFFT